MRNIDEAKELIKEFMALSPEEQKFQNAAFNKAMEVLFSEPYQVPGDFKESKEQQDFPALDRLAAKNLTVSPHDAVVKLQENNPDLDFQYKPNGDIYFSKKGKNEWSPIDPTTNPFNPDNWNAKGVKEMALDVGDTAADLVKGAIQGASTAAGAVFGGPPGAMAAGGASGAGGELARQAISQGLGYSKSMDFGQAGLEGAIGTATPMLFGTGVGANYASKVGAKAMLPASKQKMVQKVAESLGRENKEVAGWAIDRLLKEAGKTAKYGGALPAAASGAGEIFKSLHPFVAKETIQTMADRPKAMAKTSAGVVDKAEEFGNRIIGFAERNKAKSGRRLSKAFPKGAAVDASEVMDTMSSMYRDPLRKFESAVPRTEAWRDAKTVVDQISGAGQNILNKMDADNRISPREYRDIKEILTNLAGYGEKQGVQGRPISDSAASTFKKVAQKANEKLSSAAGSKYPEVANANKLYSSAAELEQSLTKDIMSQLPGRGYKVDVKKIAKEYSDPMSKDIINKKFVESMTPKQFSSYMDAVRDLGANIDYHYNPKNAAIGVGGKMDMALRFAPSQKAADVASSILRQGQRGAALGRLAAPVVAPPMATSVAENFIGMDTATQSGKERASLADQFNNDYIAKIIMEMQQNEGK